MAEDTVIKVAAGQERLNWQQKQLHSNYEDVQRSISFSLKGNVKALHHEKMLIDSGRRQLKEMAKTVKEKLGWCRRKYVRAVLLSVSMVIACFLNYILRHVLEKLKE